MGVSTAKYNRVSLPHLYSGQNIMWRPSLTHNPFEPNITHFEEEPAKPDGAAVDDPTSHALLFPAHAFEPWSARFLFFILTPFPHPPWGVQHSVNVFRQVISAPRGGLSTGEVEVPRHTRHRSHLVTSTQVRKFDGLVSVCSICRCSIRCNREDPYWHQGEGGKLWAG